MTTNLETNPSIWRSIRHPDIRRPIQSFLYHTMHNSLRVGKFWLHIKNLEHRAKCALCGAPVEDLEHILTQCPSPERTTIWEAACRAWPASLSKWQQPTYGQILGSGSLSPSAATDRKHMALEQARTRLLHITISESAHLIWALRCERVISERTHTTKEIKTRWLAKMNLRLNIDRRCAALPNRLLLPQRIKQTWQPMLNGEMHLPDNWVTDPEVLVGIMLPRPSD